MFPNRIANVQCYIVEFYMNSNKLKVNIQQVSLLDHINLKEQDERYTPSFWHAFVYILTHFYISQINYRIYTSLHFLRQIFTCKSLHSRKSFVLGELSFARMPSRQYCLKVNKVHSCNWRPELVNCGQWQPWGVVTQHGMTQILGHPKLLQKLNAPHICRN